jgi:hypothetical protein
MLSKELKELEINQVGQTNRFRYTTYNVDKPHLIDPVWPISK